MLELTKVQLYDAFGELLYAVAKADGEVQMVELNKIEELLNGFEGEEAVKWSFKYEFEKNKTVEEAYAKALDICKHYGPCPDYPFLFNVIRRVAEASDGLDKKEQTIIENFEKELMAFFQKN